MREDPKERGGKPLLGVKRAVLHSDGPQMGGKEEAVGE